MCFEEDRYYWEGIVLGCWKEIKREFYCWGYEGLIRKIEGGIGDKGRE